jgi:benzoyl-CoA reductase/2-hydroxyglutaryl-CoA dehydratase subunit BcrC/BadD/HgdB
MNTLETLVDAALQDPAAAARRAKSSGQRVIGFLGTDVPEELIAAADAFPWRLPAAAEILTALADQYLEASFQPQERAVAQQWLAGAFDFIDAVVFTRANDSIQRLYYYLCELRRRQLCAGPSPLLFDLCKIPRASSALRTQAVTATLSESLGSRLDQLPLCIRERNRRRQLLLQLQQRRAQNPAPAGSFVERLARASDYCAAREFDAALAHWLEQPMRGAPGPRLILAGSAPPDDRLHRAVERAGGNIVAELGDHALGRLGATISGEADPILALSLHYHAHRNGPRAFSDAAADLLEAVRSTRADGVIFWLLEQEEALAWDLPAQLRALEGATVPSLQLLHRRWTADDGALDEIREFIGAHWRIA